MRSGGIFDYDRRKVKIIELQEKTRDPEFWNDPQSAQKVMQALDFEKEIVGKWDELDELRESIGVYIQFEKEGEDVAEEIEAESAKFVTLLQGLELQNMMSDPAEHRDAIVTFKLVAWGSECQDWVSLHISMIHRWDDNQGTNNSVWE